MTREELLDEIQRVAGELGLPVWRLPRSRFVEASPTGWAFEQHGSWMSLRAEASGRSYGPAERQDPPIDPPVPDGHVVKGVSTMVDAHGNTKLQWIKTRQDVITPEEMLSALMETLPEAIAPRVAVIEPPTSSGSPDLLAVYPMGDPHLGMRAWAAETRDDDFDLPRALEITKGAIDALVTQGPSTESALIVNLGDFFHADNIENRTMRSGHALDVDTRWPKVLSAGIDLMIYIIDRCLENHARVKVINEIGNHDDHSAIMLSVGLNAYYRNEPRVEIDLSPSRFHYHVFGKNLIGVTHGHKVKHEDLESIMAADCPEWWGQTKHRLWLCGHIHTSRRFEYRGCLVETFRTLAPKDAWTAESGYRSGRDMNRLVLHSDFGEVQRASVSAAYLKARFDGA